MLVLGVSGHLHGIPSFLLFVASLFIGTRWLWLMHSDGEMRGD